MNKSPLLPPLLSMTYFSTSVWMTTSKLDSRGTIVNKNSFSTTPSSPPFIFVQQINWMIRGDKWSTAWWESHHPVFQLFTNKLLVRRPLLHVNQALNKQCMKLFPDSQQTYAMRTSKRPGTGRCVIAWPSGKAAPLRVGLCHNVTSQSPYMMIVFYSTAGSHTQVQRI